MWQYILTILIGLAAACFLVRRAVRNLRKLRRGESPCACCRNECCRNKSLGRRKCDKKVD